ncbi:MAG: DinB family protein [Actinomycetota bacterium]
MITAADFLVFCRRTIAGIEETVERIGDAHINVRPDLPGVSTPYQLATHTFAAATFWCAHVVCGRPTSRVRDDEFVAVGTVDELRARAQDLVALLEELAPEMATATELANPPPQTQNPLEGEWTVGAALIHAYEELAQHLGHLEMTADVLLAA